MSPIAITGLGLVTPFGTAPRAFADALAAGRTAIGPLTQFDLDGVTSKCAASVTGFDATQWIPPLKIRRMDLTSQFAIAAVREALDSAGFAYGADPQDSTGVAVGTYTAGGSRTEEFLDGLFRLGPIGAPALLFNATVANVAASLVALELKFRGPNITVSQKEASGLLALGHAVDLLHGGQADAIIAAGVDALYPLFYKVHDRFAVLSRANGVPEGSRPFDATRNGFVLGEGAYAALLESEPSRIARGASVLAEILAIECGGTSPGMNQWPIDAGALARVMRRAIHASGLSPGDIDVVYASANSSRALDAIEAAALRLVFPADAPIVTSIKGALGEASACGTASVIAAILCGRRGIVPPVAGLREIDPACAHLNLATRAMRVPGPVAVVNSIASGGAVASLVLRLCS